MEHPFSERSVFEGETFSTLALEEREISDKEFFHCTFKNCKLGLTRWPLTRFEDCIFEDCDLVRMQPARMALHGVVFLRCRLMGVDWSAVSKNPEVEFTDCHLRYSAFVTMNLRKTEFLRCTITDASFIDVALCEATFHECDLGATQFRRCDLTKADLSQARGVFVDPKENVVKGCRVALESAVALAFSTGMKVAGFEE